MKKITKILLLGFAAILSPQFTALKAQPAALSYITVNGKKYVDLNRNGRLDIYENTSLPIQERINNLVSLMTNEEKADLLVGMGMPDDNNPIRVAGAAGGTYAVKRLGIPYIVVSDGPAGMRISPTRPNTTNTFYCTAFPVATALASTWNVPLVQSVGKAIGNEVKEYGADVLLAPAMNLQRNPLCGRNFEYYSEDPLIAGDIAAAYVRGVQSNGVGTAIKHFAANNQEVNRFSINEHISERALRELYLRSFEIAVKEAQPWTVMSSYNKINGIYTSSNKDLLTNVLCSEWGFKGCVMTDWFGGYPSAAAMFDAKAVSDVVAQENAGNDLLMPGTPNQRATILKAINNGTLSKTVVDNNVKKVLMLIFKSPTFAHYQCSNAPDLKAHAKVSLNAASEAVVLLKNDNNTLPYTPSSMPVSVFGNTSYSFYAGGTGSGNVNKAYVVSLLDGLKNEGYKLYEKLPELYIPYMDKKNKEENERLAKAGMFSRTIRIPELNLTDNDYSEAADNSDMAFITIGRNAGEGFDRGVNGDFDLAEDEKNLIDNVSQAFHAKGKKVVVILNVGGVVETASWKNKVDAIVLAWQLGQEGGNAVAKVMSGNVNPSGRLPMTLAVNYSDYASSQNWLVNDTTDWTGTSDPRFQNVTYKEGIYVGYRYFNTFNVKPSYEFGYGLSYTDFKFSDLKLSNKVFGNNMTVSLDITNTGKIAGKEVAELYLSAPAKELNKPSEELKAFAKTKLLQPGESQKITFTLKASDLASFYTKASEWIAEGGKYTVSIGASSLDIKQKGTFVLPSDRVVEKTHAAFAEDVKFNDMK